MTSLSDVLKILYQIKFPIDIETSVYLEEFDDVVQYNGYGMFRFYEYRKFFLIKGRSNIEDISEIGFYSEWSRLFLHEDKFDLAWRNLFKMEMKVTSYSNMERVFSNLKKKNISLF